eukprot:TRINITY_DN2186_c1_g1_i3.p1 TRINITY_DN2186_c1_g1~~TRINITY_DN2186_c1_g1_i3.p1  ORF type:complete len:116 (+),score=16.89 TRINITY_DN2186_c1_g1_i3:265-612(+)
MAVFSSTTKSHPTTETQEKTETQISKFLYQNKKIAPTTKQLKITKKTKDTQKAKTQKSLILQDTISSSLPSHLHFLFSQYPKTPTSHRNTPKPKNVETHSLLSLTDVAETLQSQA